MKLSCIQQFETWFIWFCWVFLYIKRKITLFWRLFFSVFYLILQSSFLQPVFRWERKLIRCFCKSIGVLKRICWVVKWLKLIPVSWQLWYFYWILWFKFLKTVSLEKTANKHFILFDHHLRLHTINIFLWFRRRRCACDLRQISVFWPWPFFPSNIKFRIRISSYLTKFIIIIIRYWCRYRR